MEIRTANITGNLKGGFYNVQYQHSSSESPGQENIISNQAIENGNNIEGATQ